MSKHLVSPGMYAAMGGLILTLEATASPSFKVGGASGLLSCEVVSPGAVLGCDDEADIVISGPPERTEEISGFHLIFTPSAWGWLVTDDRSTNGTSVRSAGDRRSRPLVASHPVCVEDGMVLTLPHDVQITVKMLRRQTSRITANAKRPLAVEAPVKRIADARLQELASLLARSKHPDAPQVIRSAEWVAEAMACKPRTAHWYKKKLAKLDGITVARPDHVTFDDLADAVIKACPWLVDPPTTKRD